MNLVFWLILLCLLGIALWPLLRVLSGTPKDRKVDRQAQNKAIYQAQLIALEEKKAANAISATEYADSVAELENNLNNDMPLQANAANIHSSKSILPWILVAGIPLLTSLLYMHWGNPLAIDAENYPRIQQQHAQTQLQQQITQLKKDIAASPNDIEKHLMLAQAYLNISDLNNAKSILEAAYQQAPEHISVMLTYAEVLSELNNRSMAGLPADLIRKARKLSPESRKANWLYSVLAVQERNFAEAVQLWNNLLATATDPEEKNFLEGLLAQVKSRQASDDKKSSTDDARTTQLSINITLDPKIRAQLDPNDTVFIFAKAYSATGNAPRMPLAILKKTVRDLPGEFILSDANSMMPTAMLSSFEQVIVGARISKSGDAIARSGDFQALSKPVHSSATVSLQISDIIP